MHFQDASMKSICISDAMYGTIIKTAKSKLCHFVVIRSNYSITTIQNRKMQFFFFFFFLEK
jgi:hypothetical protein